MSEENVVEFPDSPEEWPLLPKMYLRIAMGDQSAADLLETVAVIERLADNIVDNESEDTSADMTEVLYRMFVGITSNSFFNENRVAIITAFGLDVISWDLSNEYHGRKNIREQMIGFVKREAINIYVVVAMICGGFDHARSIIREIYEFNTEEAPTLEEWISKHEVPLAKTSEK